MTQPVSIEPPAEGQSPQAWRHHWVIEIMETRVSDWNGRLPELMDQLTSTQSPEWVPVDQVPLTEAIQAIIEMNRYVQATMSDQT